MNPEPLTLHHEPEVNPEPLTGIYELTLTSPDGRERKMLAFLPNEETKNNYLSAANRRGLEVVINENENQNKK